MEFSGSGARRSIIVQLSRKLIGCTDTKYKRCMAFCWYKSLAFIYLIPTQFLPLPNLINSYNYISMHHGTNQLDHNTAIQLRHKQPSHALHIKHVVGRNSLIRKGGFSGSQKCPRYYIFQERRPGHCITVISCQLIVRFLPPAFQSTYLNVYILCPITISRVTITTRGPPHLNRQLSHSGTIIVIIKIIIL